MVRNVILVATLVVVAVTACELRAASWDLVIGPVAIGIACLFWRKDSQWAPLPALLQALFGLANTWGVRFFTPSFLQAFFGFTIRGGHRLYSDLRTYDYQLLAVDASFGFQPSLALRHLLERTHLFPIFIAVYDLLPVAMALAYILHLRDRKNLSYIPLVFALAMLGGAFYHVLPASGPVYLLGTDHFVGECGVFCSSLKELASDTSRLHAISLVDARWPRNCLPSLHVTWALLTFLVCADRRAGRWLSGTFLIGTALATMATGEHYLVDVITAFPFAVIVWKIGAAKGTGPERFMPIGYGAVMLLGWIFLIRTVPAIFWLSPIVPWTAALVTIAGSWRLLAPAEQAGQGEAQSSSYSPVYSSSVSGSESA